MPESVPKEILTDPSEVRRSLVAERRGLLITGFILFFYQAAGLRIEKINIFGNEVGLSDPWWISVALWLLWTYFLLRYLQYFMATEDKGFSRAFEQWMKRIIRRSSFRRFKKSFVPDEECAAGKADFRVRNETFPLKYPQFWSVELEISVAYQLKDGAAAGSRTHKEDVQSWRLLWTKIKAITYVLFLTHVATEYFLPFVIALLPIGAVLYQLAIMRFH